MDTVKSMENKSISSQLPTEMRLGNTVTTDKSTIIENFNNHFSTAGHAFHLASATLAKQICTPRSNIPKSPLPLLPHPNPDS
jgi:predicted S18 family serine protease